MRLASGVNDQYVYFIALDVSNAPLVGYAAKMTVKRSRNGGALATYTTPTINATDTGGGGYELLVDEDVTIDAGDFTQEYYFRVKDTGGHMVPVRRTIELFRPSDTGGIADAVWAYATRALTAFSLDTGIAQTVWRSSTSTFTGDTGSVAYAQGRVMAVRTDTGAAHLDQGRFGVLSDSGVAAAVLDTGKVAAAAWTSHATRTLTAFALDTGIAQTVWRESSSTYTGDTGSVAYAQGRLMAVRTDTGAAHLDQGRLGVISDSGRQAAVLDTGKVASAIWTSHATRTLTAFAFDTGVVSTVLDQADAIETGLTVRGALRLNSAMLVGVASGAGTGTEVFKNAVANSKTRVTVTVDSSGNRSALTTDVT